MKFRNIALLLVIAVLPVIAYTVNAQSNTGQDVVLLDTIYPIKDESARALVALAAMYTPSEDEAEWSKMVCRGMTDDGCAYFNKS